MNHQRQDCLDRLIDTLKERNLIMGVLNVTPDSFSDGGKYITPETALQQAFQMIQAGADLIDIGGESSRPGSQPVPASEQIRRILPVIQSIRIHSNIPLSIDTTHPEVACKGLEAGATLINDISACEQYPSMAEIVLKHHAGMILMHKRGNPADMQANTDYGDLIGETRSYLKKKADLLIQFGIKKHHLWLDPGIGFGKSFEGNLEILRKIREYDSLGHPIVVGVSRKAFIGHYLDRSVENRLAGTLAITAWLAHNQPHRIHRVHDVAENRDVLRMTEILAGR